ncbi:MAG TPA: hypothetical protein PKI14_06005 [Fervidobacterium sp.]|nr:hypothetical protein [Fervidobacterium sp.]HOM74270.1 hypothetical protein [Fervidobacterium sp.]HOQ39772.1 hypothetical protein [Fervidobacterium sp.]HPP17926.1 hypothetical protein [Fervidobacterium sp.]HPT54295.1 hypothetical protein [Fervidobacterium sp.]
MSFDIESLKSTISLINANWYFLLPISIFVFLFPNLIEVVTILGVGFIISSSYITPFLYGVITKFFPDLFGGVVNSGGQNMLVSIIISIIFAIIFYGLYKSFIFLGGFLLTFFSVQFLINNLVHVELAPYIFFAISALAGLIGGFYASKNSEKLLGIIGVAISAFSISSIAFTLLKTHVFDINDVLYLWLIFIIAVFLFFLRITKLWRKGK